MTQFQSPDVLPGSRSEIALPSVPIDSDDARQSDSFDDHLQRAGLPGEEASKTKSLTAVAPGSPSTEVPTETVEVPARSRDEGLESGQQTLGRVAETNDNDLRVDAAAAELDTIRAEVAFAPAFAEYEDVEPVSAEKKYAVQFDIAETPPENPVNSDENPQRDYEGIDLEATLATDRVLEEVAVEKSDSREEQTAESDHGLAAQVVPDQPVVSEPTSPPRAGNLSATDEQGEIIQEGQESSRPERETQKPGASIPDAKPTTESSATVSKMSTSAEPAEVAAEAKDQPNQSGEENVAERRVVDKKVVDKSEEPVREASIAGSGNQESSQTPKNTNDTSIRTVELAASAAKDSSSATSAPSTPEADVAAAASMTSEASGKEASDPATRLSGQFAARRTAEPLSDIELNESERARFVQRVAGAFSRTRGEDGTIRLRLAPPELGTLQLEVKLRDGVMVARLETETNEARQLLLQNLPMLRERLGQQEITIEQFDVELRDDVPEGSTDHAEHDLQHEHSDQRLGNEDATEDDEPAESGKPQNDDDLLNVIV